MGYNISLPDLHKKYSVKPGTRLIEILQHHHLDVTAPCGGKGTCQKCLVTVERLGPVLSCQLTLNDDLWQKLSLGPDEPLIIHLPQHTQTILAADDIIPRAELSPLVCRGLARLPVASLVDQRPDDQRFEAATGCHITLTMLNDLAKRTADGSSMFHFDFRTDTHEVLRFVDAADTPILGCAIDLGTTTLAVYLFDLMTGERLAQTSRLNPQKIFGADVISRIEYASVSPENLLRLQTILTDKLVEMIDSLVTQVQANSPDRHTGSSLQNIQMTDVMVVTLAGNTTMMHLVSGLMPTRIGIAPFIPVSIRGQIVSAATVGLSSRPSLNVSPSALVVLLPSIAGYVGADITAGILACDLQHEIHHDPHQNQRIRARVLLDIGTNGEIALAGPKGLIACATAAGPAFEGATIACGMPAMPGAVDQASFDGHGISVSVIDEHMTGICGSGLVALVASFLDAGLIDETGRILDEDEISESVATELKSLIGEVGTQTVIFIDQLPKITNADKLDASTQTSVPISGSNRVYLSQKDIRELQNAKAAIAAGLQILIRESGLDDQELSELDLAGGFGNYLNVNQAIRIGLIPEDIRGKVKTVGNTSGLGASHCLLDDRKRLEASEIARQVSYLELSGNPLFSDLYIDSMIFPEKP